jgi:hypothetical protein
VILYNKQMMRCPAPRKDGAFYANWQKSEALEPDSAQSAAQTRSRSVGRAPGGSTYKKFFDRAQNVEFFYVRYTIELTPLNFALRIDLNIFYCDFYKPVVLPP